MKHIKKLLVFAIVAVMMLSICSLGAWADTQPSGQGGSASITITLPTDTQAPTGTTTYKIYKVFDATSDGTSSAISYQLVSGKTAPVTATDSLSKFDVDTAGNVHFYSRASTSADWAEDTTTTALSAGMVEAIAAYVGDADLVYTARVSAGETSVTVTELEYGYYYIASSTGSVVTVNSTNPNAEVSDKNVIPPVFKSPGTAYDAASLQAIAAVGTSQPFTAEITKTHGAINLKFVDTMTDMSFNNDLAITVSAGTAPTAAQAVVTPAEDGSGFTVQFDNDYIAGLADGTIITLKYSATVLSDALSVDPATNTATLNSGEGNTSTSETSEVYNAKLTVSKKDGDGKALAGAGFVIAKTVADTSEGAEEGATKQVYYKLAEVEGKKSISWVDSIDDATEYTSDEQGEVPAFTGLGVGEYILIEKTVPGGYNKADDTTFEIKDNDYTAKNLEQEAEVTNEEGAVLPSTGGIGTTIFYTVGGILMVGAAIVLVTKKRVSQKF